MLKYVRLVEWSSKDGDIQLQMLGEDGEIHRFDVSTECAGALVAGLAAEVEKRNGADADRQFVRPTGMQTAKTEGGEPALLMTLPGGVELPLVFKLESLPVLIAELEKLSLSLQPGSTVRWH